MKLQNRLLSLSIFLLFLGVVFNQQLFGQSCNDSTPAQYMKIGTVYDIYKVVPSMVPRPYIKVGYRTVQQPPISFNDSDISNFIIVKNGENISKRLKIEDVYPVGGNKYLVFDSQVNKLKKGDKLNVGLCVTFNGNPNIIWDSNDDTTRKEIEVPNITANTFTLTPDVVPDQELVDGTKQTVGQVKIKFDVPSIIQNDSVARFYFNTDNTISTNWKDKNSKVEFKFGAERSLNNKWYVPLNLEAKINGEQRFKNATFVASTGLKTIVPWRWTREVLFNSVIRAPISPEFGVFAEYHRRLKQDAKSLEKFPKKDSFALRSEFTWLPIQLFTKSCKDDQGAESFENCFNAGNVSLELSAKGWWFPFEKTLNGTKVRRFEGRVEASLFIPLSIPNKFLFSKDSENGFNSTQRLRIKYVTGANDATGFKRSSQLTFGIEIIK